MEYRNLNRVFCYNKAVRLWARQGQRLKDSEVMILVALSHYDRPVSLVKLGEHLAAFGRTIGANWLQAALRRLHDLGMVDIIGKPAKYVLTIAGVNSLNGLEKTCRDCRYDR